jgi:hypothetical protein
MNKFLLLNIVMAVLLGGKSCLCSDSPLLPQGVKKEIANKYENWRILEVSDLNEDDQAIWKKTKGDTHPGVATGQYDNSGKLMYSVTIIPKENKKVTYKILMIKEVSPGSYLSLMLEEYESKDEYGNYPVIYKEKPGKYYYYPYLEKERDYDVQHVMEIKADVLVVEYLESSAKGYYWKNGKFHKITLSY